MPSIFGDREQSMAIGLNPQVLVNFAPGAKKLRHPHQKWWGFRHLSIILSDAYALHSLLHSPNLSV